MFCPNCKYQYKHGIIICPDCGEKLVEKLEEEPKLTFDTVELCDVEDEFQAQFLIFLLTENSIECFLRENFLSHSRVVLGEKRKYGTVIVNKQKLEKAEELIKDIYYKR